MEKKEVFKNFELAKHRDSLYAANNAGAAMLLDVINELEVTKGAMILDGYEVEDSCVKFLEKSINIFKKKYGQIKI